MKERDNLLYILKKTKNAIKSGKIIELKRLSNKTIHSASIYHDTDNIAIAVIVYALSKVMEREKYHYYSSWPIFLKNCTQNLDYAISALQREDMESFRDAISGIKNSIDKLSGHLKDYLGDVFRKASINKASRIYEHGISMQQTAEMLGISVFELAEYAGKTGISDVNLSVTKGIRERIKIAEDIFSEDG